MSQQRLIMDGILKTKLMMPLPKSEILIQKNLHHKLERAMNYKLTLICAPAGYGKSTGVSQFMHSSSQSVAWLTLEDTENEPLRFLLYLIAAVQTAEPDFGLDLINTLQSPNPPSLDWLLSCVLNRLNELSLSLTLIFDDWHTIQAPIVQQLMDKLMTHLPDSMHVFLLTRIYPNLSFNQLRLRHQIMELYTEDLILSKTESLSFFYEVMNITRTTGSLEMLETIFAKTEGWVAGLQMFGLFIKEYGEKKPVNANEYPLSKYETLDLDHGTFEDAMSYQHRIATSLFSEIFKNLPIETQLFLMVSSVSNRFSSALCNKLLEPFAVSVDDAFIVNHLRQGHFMIALDEHNTWFRYHHLYEDFLQHRLKAWILEGASYKNIQYEMSLNDFQFIASKWFLEHQLEVEAFQLAAKGNHIDLATEILQSGDIPLIYRGTVGMALNWLHSLPDTAMNSRPWLWLMLATSELYIGKSTSANHYIQHAVQSISALPSTALSDAVILNMEVSIASLRASLAVIDHQSDEMELQATLALKLIGNRFSPARCPSLWALGYSKLLKKQLTEALELFEEAVSLSARIGHTLVYIMATIGIGNVYEEQNLLNEAERYYLRIIEKSDHQGYPVSCDAYLGMVRICLSQNRLTAAKAYIEKAQHLSNQIDRTDRKALCYELAAQLNIAQHQPVLAFNEIEKAIRIAVTEKFYHRLESFYELQCQLLILTGHLRAAQSICIERKLSLCPILIKAKEGLWLEAIDALKVRASMMPFCNWPKALLQMELFKALYYAQASNKIPNTNAKGLTEFDSETYKEMAYEAMRNAVNMAQQGHIIRPFLESSLSTKEIFALIEASNASVQYPEFKKLLREAMDTEAIWENQPEYESLSQREMEVLGLIAEGLSNEDIAERLHLALSTVKGTNQRLFSKLHVQRRTEAIAKAKVIGLI